MLSPLGAIPQPVTEHLCPGRFLEEVSLSLIHEHWVSSVRPEQRRFLNNKIENFQVFCCCHRFAFPTTLCLVGCLFHIQQTHKHPITSPCLGAAPVPWPLRIVRNPPPGTQTLTFQPKLDFRATNTHVHEGPASGLPMVSEGSWLHPRLTTEKEHSFVRTHQTACNRRIAPPPPLRSRL